MDVFDITHEIPDGVRGDVLFGGASASSLEAMNRGVRWVHWPGTGIDDVPAALRSAEFLTVSRGASAVAISEYVIAAVSSSARNFLRTGCINHHLDGASSLPLCSAARQSLFLASGASVSGSPESPLPWTCR